jgi:hypothetical protein
MMCFHKFGYIQDDGLQYCRKCGMAKRPPCKHNWKEKDSICKKQGKTIVVKVILLECINCGEHKKIKMNTLSLLERLFGK